MTRHQLSAILLQMNIGMEIFVPNALMSSIVPDEDAPSIFAIGLANGCGNIKEDSARGGYLLEKTHEPV